MLKIILPKEAVLPKWSQPKCVIKISANGKYYIGRTSNFEFLDEELRKTHRRYKHGNGIPETNQYIKLVEHMVKNDIEDIQVETLFSSENGYQVLKEELTQLCIHFGKRDCLNINNIPNVPKFKTPTSPNKWLTHNEFLNFKKLIKKYEH